MHLDELKTTLTNVNLWITPEPHTYDELQLELFFQEGLLTLEMHDLYIVGTGMLKDPDTQNLDVLQFRAPISTGNIVIRPTEVIH